MYCVFCVVHQLTASCAIHCLYVLVLTVFYYYLFQNIIYPFYFRICLLYFVAEEYTYTISQTTAIHGEEKMNSARKKKKNVWNEMRDANLSTNLLLQIFLFWCFMAICHWYSRYTLLFSLSWQSSWCSMYSLYFPNHTQQRQLLKAQFCQFDSSIHSLCKCKYNRLMLMLRYPSVLLIFDFLLFFFFSNESNTSIEKHMTISILALWLGWHLDHSHPAWNKARQHFRNRFWDMNSSNCWFVVHSLSCSNMYIVHTVTVCNACVSFSDRF